MPIGQRMGFHEFKSINPGRSLDISTNADHKEIVPAPDVRQSSPDAHLKYYFVRILREF
jgi:hypothetical protein